MTGCNGIDKCGWCGGFHLTRYCPEYTGTGQPEKPTIKDKNNFSEHINFWRILTQWLDNYEELVTKIHGLEKRVEKLEGKK